MESNKYNISNDNNYKTPDCFYNKLNDEFGFDFDPCPFFIGEITPENDGLLKEWGNVNFVNPPYTSSLKQAFVNKSIEQFKNGKTVVMLLPVVTSSNLWHDIIKPNATEIRFVRGRIKFQQQDLDGNFYTPKTGGRHDSMIVIFKPKAKQAINEAEGE